MATPGIGLGGMRSRFMLSFPWSSAGLTGLGQPAISQGAAEGSSVGADHIAP
jgi:hypothetical protein